MSTVAPVRLRMVVPVLVLAACANESGLVTTGPLPLADRPASPAPTAEALFPLSGNPGYDVERYDVDLAYDPPTGTITATAFLTAVALADLPTVTVDFGMMALDGATVDGVAVAGAQLNGGKLKLAPATPVAKGAALRAGRGVPRGAAASNGPVARLAHRLDHHPGRELHPQRAQRNQHLAALERPPERQGRLPRTGERPEPYFAVANGAVVAEERAGGRVATTWEMPQPMASSEVQIAVGPLARVDSTSPAGATLSSYVTAGGGDVTPGIGLAGQMLDFYTGLFGPYPFTTAGLIATDAPRGSRSTHRAGR